MVLAKILQKRSTNKLELESMQTRIEDGEKENQFLADSIDWDEWRHVSEVIYPPNELANAGAHQSTDNTGGGSNEAEITTVLNGCTDYCIQKVKGMFLDKGENSASFEKIDTEIKINFLGHKSDAFLRVDPGSIRDVSFLKRTGDVDVRQVGDVLSVKVPLCLEEIDGEARYLLQMDNLEKREMGRLSASVSSCSGTLELIISRRSEGLVTVGEVVLRPESDVYIVGSRESELLNEMSPSSRRKLSIIYSKMFSDIIRAKLEKAFDDVLIKLREQRVRRQQVC